MQTLSLVLIATLGIILSFIVISSQDRYKNVE